MAAAGIAASGISNGLADIGRSLTEMTKAAAEDAASQSRLKQAVENTGAAYSTYAKDLETAISKSQKLGFTDDQARNSLALLAAQTGDTAEALKRYQLAMDLSRGANIDLETASKLLGRVTEENVNVLSRYGITIADGATQTELFAAVQEKFGGQAQQFGDSVAGAAERNRIAMDELQESIGARLVPVMGTMLSLFEALPGPIQTGVAVLATMGPALGQTAIGFAALAPVISALGPLIASLGMALLTPPVGLVVALVAAGVAIYVFRDQIFGAFGAIKDFVIGALSAIVGFLSSNWKIVGTLISGPFIPLVALATDAFGIRSALLGAFASITEALGGLVSGAASKAAEFGDAIYKGIKSGVNAAIDAINTLIRAWNGLNFTAGGGSAAGVPLPSISFPTPDLGLIPRLRSGMDFVPYDNYPALLHRGERVMTAAENREGGRGGEQSITVNTYGPMTIVQGGAQGDSRKALRDLAFAVAAEMRSTGHPRFA